MILNPEWSYCKENRIDALPEMLLFQNNRVRKYFSQKFDVSEINEENMKSFVYEFTSANPMRKAVRKPEYDSEQCCDAILVVGENMRGRGEGRFLLFCIF